MNKRQSILLILLIATIVIVISSGTIVHLITESWWFEAVGFAEVFWTRISWQLAIGVATFVLYVLFTGLNYWLAIKLSPEHRIVLLKQAGLINDYSATVSNMSAILMIGLAALWAALVSAPNWIVVLQFLNTTEAGVLDPVYQQDISFYLFQLPFLEVAQTWLLGLLIVGLLAAIGVYGLRGAIEPNRGWMNLFSGPVKVHLGVLIAAIAFLAASYFWLQRYRLLYSPTGVVFGGGYTDLHARLESYWVIGFATIALGTLLIISLWRRGIALPIYGLAMYMTLALVVGRIYPALQQQFVVEPNELTKENPYIAHNIEMTRQAYQLDRVQSQDYAVENRLTRDILAQNESTISNIRLWDYRPLLSTYRQIQELRPYYRFNDVDVDRYTINDTYRQVMISARELETKSLPAQTWVNQRLKYTHGYGVVMSPVDRVTPDGLPEFFIKDIPPVATGGVELNESAIYYGELTRDYIFTGMGTDEFDYPLGDENAAVRYSGQGGVPLPSLWRRLVYALDQGSLKILISNYFTQNSRIHYHRQIQERIRQIAPFLYFDNDPYIAIIDGRLQWIVDAYTLSNRYPYSEPIFRINGAGSVLRDEYTRQLLLRGVNYIRNSVKVLVDAYDGTLQFYAVDTDDPVLQTYSKIFPTLLTPKEQIPQGIWQHFRYPLDLFKIQALMYLDYHMNNPEVFYNKEDRWTFPTEVFEGNQQLTEPYYLIMRLPDEEEAEMVLILPFTPVSKNNMIAWMTARSDGANYGKLLLYEFPKQELIYGPSQIEARIDQTPEISEQLTLWNQQGSRLIRGNLLVIPIEQSLLYAEPIYLRAEQGELPELKRVIISYNDRVVMESTLEQALTTIFGEPSPNLASQTIAVSPDSTDPTAPSSSDSVISDSQLARSSVPQPIPGANLGDVSQLIDAALDTYQNAEDALRQGNWSDYGQYQQELERLLQKLDQLDQLDQQTATNTATNLNTPDLPTPTEDSN